jgi:hypothetical protein
MSLSIYSCLAIIVSSVGGGMAGGDGGLLGWANRGMLGNLYWCNPSNFYILLNGAFQCILNTHHCSSKLDSTTQAFPP